VDFSLVLSTSAAKPSLVAQLVDERRADGVILMEVDLRDRRVQRLRADDYAFSVIGHPELTDGVNYVDVDISAAVRGAIEHLTEYGHKRILLFNEAPRGREHVYGPTCRARVAFAECTEELSVDGYEVDVPREKKRAYEVATAVLKDDAPTAVIALGTSSPAVVDAARDLGLRIPHDLSLIGFLLKEQAELRQLTNVDLPAFDMGHLGAKMLISRLVDPKGPATQILLQPPLTVRESTGPAPRRRRGSQSK
jgi:DNA-binding LacI/PurR family transcriptional regulator